MISERFNSIGRIENDIEPLKESMENKKKTYIPVGDQRFKQHHADLSPVILMLSHSESPIGAWSGFTKEGIPLLEL
jgi:hypothetical protein